MQKERKRMPLEKSMAIVISLIAIFISIFSLSHNISAERNQRECNFLYRQLERMSNVSERIPLKSPTLLLWMRIQHNAILVKKEKSMKIVNEQLLKEEIIESLKELMINYKETERLNRIVDINRYFLKGTLDSDSRSKLEKVENELKRELGIVDDLMNDSIIGVDVLAQSVKKMQDIIIKYHDAVDNLVHTQVEIISTKILSSCSD